MCLLKKVSCLQREVSCLLKERYHAYTMKGYFFYQLRFWMFTSQNYILVKQVCKYKNAVHEVEPCGKIDISSKEYHIFLLLYLGRNAMIYISSVHVHTN